jgi:hypothetical protein
VTGGWKKVQNEELHNLYFSPSIILMNESERKKWSGHVSRMGEKRNAYRILMEKPEGKIPLGRPKCRWVDNIVTCCLKARMLEQIDQAHFPRN